jgi:2-desacetyl-2-hydroxyethyl bacteriochlorophyllide A dehydrogenase
MAASTDLNPTVTIVGPRRVEVRNEPVRRPGRGEVLTQTLYSGISAGTELNVYRGLAPQWRRRQDEASGLFKDDGPEWRYPLVYGYANVGTVAEVGEGLDRRLLGETVFGYQPHRRFNTVDYAATTRLPALDDPRRGIFLANVNTALNGVLDARPALGEVVVVMGLGVIGLLVTRLVRRAGAGLVVAVDGVPARRRFAQDAGADLTLEPSDAVADVVRERTGGRGADVVIDVSGAPAALNAAIRTVGRDGRVIAMSWYSGAMDGLDLSAEFHHNRVRVRSSQVDHVNPDLGPLWSVARRNAVALDLVRELPLERYITTCVPPAGAPEAYALLDRRDPDTLQCVFDFSGLA